MTGALSTFNIHKTIPQFSSALTAFCVEPGDDNKAFVGQQMGIDAGTVFGNTDRYDVSMEPFHLTPLK
jgi:hypothetical protein